MTKNNLPPLPADVLADMRKMAGSHVPPARPMSFELDLAKKESKQRPLSRQECIDIFGAAVAVKMNFIPQMLMALVMQKVIDFINFCVEHRLQDFKKHTRAMRKCVEEYSRGLFDHYGELAHRSYLYYVERFMALVTTDVYMMMLNLQEAASNQLPDKKHREIAAMMCFIVLVIRFCDNYDREMDELIESRVGTSVRRNRDALVQHILDLSIDLASKYGYELKIPDNAAMWVKILSNRAYAMADEILAEEKVT